MKRKWIYGLWSLVFVMFFCVQPILGEESARVHVTILKASNVGNDFNMVNDAFRDELIKLFSYSAYSQVEDLLVDLSKAERKHTALPEGYELILTLQGIEKGRVLVQAIIRKDNKQYVDTILSILKPGVVFVGGPRLSDSSDLIIVLEIGF